MRLTNTSNPALSEKVLQRSAARSSDEGVMTVNGAVNRTLLMLALVVLSASLVWGQFSPQNPGATQGWLIFGAIGGFIAALVTIFKHRWAPITAPIYALLQGLFLGGISAFFEAMYPGIVMQAVALTFAVMLAMLALYRSGWIKVTQKFRMGVMAATGGLAMFYLLSIVLGMFNVEIPMLYSSSPIGIGFSIIVVIIAALNLVLDFDFIDRAAQAQAPKHIEWYAAFGLTLTLIWLYIEILRLLSRFASGD